MPHDAVTPAARATVSPLPPLTAGTDWASTDRLHRALFADTGLTAPPGHIPQGAGKQATRVADAGWAGVVTRLRALPDFAAEARAVDRDRANRVACGP
jgi:hypothetical protein